MVAVAHAIGAMSGVSGCWSRAMVITGLAGQADDGRFHYGCCCPSCGLVVVVLFGLLLLLACCEYMEAVAAASKTKRRA